MKQEYINRLNTIIAHSETYEYCTLEAVITDWAKGKNDRTYFAIVEKSKDGHTSKHYVKKDYGYYDNVNDEYVPAKSGNLDNNYTFSGTKF